MQKNTKKIAILSLLEVLTAVFLFFTKWFGVQSYYGDDKMGITLWKTADLLSSLSYYIEDSTATVLSVLIYIVLGLSILLMVYTAYTLYQNYKSGAKISLAGLIFPAVLSVFLILLIAIENAHINDEWGFKLNMLYLTAVPFLALIVAIVALAVNRKMPDTLPSGGENGTLRPSGSSVLTPRTPSRSCPVCGAACADPNATFCSVCGAKMDTKILCSHCGAELKPNVRFCSNCGAPVQRDPVNPDRSFDLKDN